MRLRDVEFGSLARVIPPKLIGDALRECGRRSKRRRKLPSESVVWLVVAMALFRRLSVEACFGRVASVLGLTGFRETPHSTSLAEARDRLGFEVLRLIYRRFAALLWEKYSGLSKWLGLNVFVLDGSTFRTADTPQNDREFGRPGASRRKGKSAFPQLRVVALVSAWTHVVVDAAFGPYFVNELKVSWSLVARIPPNSVLLLDRAFHCFVWPARLRAVAVDVVVRAKTGKSVIATRLGDYLGPRDRLAHLLPTGNTRRKHPDLTEEVPVRLITRTRRGFRPITLVTTLLDPKKYSAQAIVDLYTDRWEAELAYRELKTELNQEWVTFRSRKPARVLQEAYGLLLAYNCVRSLMCEGAKVAGAKPLRLSFRACLVRVQWFLSGDAPFVDFDQLLDSLASALLPARRKGRSCPRAVKVRAKKYPAKRPGQRPTRTRYQDQRRRKEQGQEARALTA